METKPCTKCGEVKEIGEFHKNKRNKGGLNRICKPCQREYNNSLYRKSARCVEHKSAQALAKARLESGLKLCSKCKNIKPISEFCKSPDHIGGLTGQCKSCLAEYRVINRESLLAYRESNKEAATKSNKAYIKNNKKRLIKLRKTYVLENKNKFKEYDRSPSGNPRYVDALPPAINLSWWMDLLP
ncbi:MAG: hypothetical protein PF495_01645 [Spirochaetales bacterium]|nr:hypothetical protein [Spirochaetales bacterium]